jgi:hypothetical protein
MLLSACANIQLENPAVLSPFGDGTQWIVLQDMDFSIKLQNKKTAIIRVPRGFVTDLASTPKAVWSIYPPFGKYLVASILHDYLYWRQSCSREQADKILYQAMRDSGVDQSTQTRFFDILNSFGGQAWNANKAEQAKYLIRVIPEENLENDFFMGSSSKMDWDTYRNRLLQQHIPEPVIDSDKTLPQVCSSLGNEIEVKTGFMTALFGK